MSNHRDNKATIRARVRLHKKAGKAAERHLNGGLCMTIVPRGHVPVLVYPAMDLSRV